MLTAEQMALRRTGITATDATVIAGVCPYKRTVADVLAEKRGETEPFETTTAMRVGNVLEAPLLGLLAEDREIVVLPGNKTYIHPYFPWALATPDGVVFDGKRMGSVCEIKCVGAWLSKTWKAHSPPQHVVVQVMWQMAVTCTRRAYVGALLGGTDWRTYVVDFDENMGADLLSVCGEWWERHVVKGEPL